MLSRTRCSPTPTQPAKQNCRMRLLFVIPHYFGGNHGQPNQPLPGKHGSIEGTADTRVQAVRRTVMSLHQTFGPAQAMIRHVDRCTEPANAQLRHQVHVVIVTTGSSHLLKQAKFSEEDCFQLATDHDPTRLGFRCHELMRDRWGNYDYFCYLEDDLSISDPWFFEKLRWFNSHVGDDKVLMPNRFERGEGLAYAKCYLDGELARRASEPFQDLSEQPELKSTVMGKPIRMIRPSNPHSGCFFLNASQMQTWISQPYFGSDDTRFIGPLESAATLGVMRTFRIYKPAPEHAGFLEIEHFGSRFLELVRKPVAP